MFIQKLRLQLHTQIGKFRFDLLRRQLRIKNLPLEIRIAELHQDRIRLDSRAGSQEHLIHMRLRFRGQPTRFFWHQCPQAGDVMLQHHVSGLGTLVPEETRWLAAETQAHVDQVFLRAGARVQPDSILMQLSNPDLERQVLDAELATKKVEAELANLRVQLQAQLLNEHAMEAQLQSDLTEAKLQAERDEALQKAGIGAAMNAKISRARADSLTTRLQIEKEKLAIAEEARQAQLAAKQAEVAQVQALYELKLQQKDALHVRAGIAGVLEEVTVDAGQQVAIGTNLA